MMSIFLLTVWGQAILLSSIGESRVAQRYNYSTQAFWLADGAIEQAMVSLPGTLLSVPNGRLGNGTYTVSTVSSGANTWTVNATGTVNNQRRSIQATIYNPPASDFNNILTISGTYDPKHAQKVSGPVVSNDATTIPQIFGDSLTQLESLATTTEPSNWTGSGTVSGITTFSTTSDTTLTGITTGSNGAFLIIDTTGASSTPTISIKNASFVGVILVVGNVTFSGSSNVSGAIFVFGNVNFQDSGVNLTYSSTNEGGALGPLIKPHIISWKEI